MTYENCRERRTAHWYIVTSQLLKPLRRFLIDITSFRLPLSLYSLPVLFKRTTNLGSPFFFSNLLYRRIYETKFPTHVSLLFSIFYSSCHLKFLCDAQNLPFVRNSSFVIKLAVCCYLQQ